MSLSIGIVASQGRVYLAGEISISPSISVGEVAEGLQVYINGVLNSTIDLPSTLVKVGISATDTVTNKPNNVILNQSLFENVTTEGLVTPTISDDLTYLLQTILYTAPPEAVTPDVDDPTVTESLTWELTTILGTSLSETVNETPVVPTITEDITPTLT